MKKLVFTFVFMLGITSVTYACERVQAVRNNYCYDVQSVRVEKVVVPQYSIVEYVEVPNYQIVERQVQKVQKVVVKKQVQYQRQRFEPLRQAIGHVRARSQQRQKQRQQLRQEVVVEYY